MKKNLSAPLALLALCLLLASCDPTRHTARSRPMGPDSNPVATTRPVTAPGNPTATPRPHNDDSDSRSNAFGATTASSLSYIVDGESFIGEVRTEEDLTTLYLKILGYAKLGHNVCISAGKTPCQGEGGHTVHFTSADEHAVAAWATKMVKQGYSVTVDYDKSSRTYHCTAYKPK